MGWFIRSAHPEDQLSAYIDGELDTRQAENVAGHLTSCAGCTALIEELRGAKSMLAALPREAPRRSFVLGPEHARERVVVPAAPARKRPSFSFAPAVAATLLIGLLVVDAGNFSGISQDESNTAGAGSSLSRQTAEDSAGGAPQPAQAPGKDASAESQSSGSSFRAPDASPVAGGGASGESGPTPVTAPAQAPPSQGTNIPPATGRESAPTVAVGPLNSTGTDAASSQPAGDDRDGFADGTASVDEDGSGLSTLRVLEILAALALVASVFFVYVRPRLFERK